MLGTERAVWGGGGEEAKKKTGLQKSAFFSERDQRELEEESGVRYIRRRFTYENQMSGILPPLHNGLQVR